MDLKQAKKYLNKAIYCLDDTKSKPTVLYIGGINLYFNQVDFDVTSFHAFKNNKYNESWGDIKIDEIKDKFIKEDFRYGLQYTFSKSLAEEILPIYKKYRKNINKEYAIENAKRSLDEHKVKYEIFE